MENYGAVVQAVLATEFESPVVTAAEEETGKAQLTRAAALAINRLDANVGLLRKDSGNQVYGLAVDVLVDRATGDWADIATAQGVGNVLVTIAAHWLGRTGAPPAQGYWIQPTEALALAPGPMIRTSPTPGPDPGPGPGPEPPPSNDIVIEKLDAILAQLDDLRNQAAANTARIIENDDANTQKVQEQLHQIVEDAEASGKKLLALWLAGKLSPGSPAP